jgi:membrane associated rhomboid family serine protease
MDWRRAPATVAITIVTVAASLLVFALGWLPGATMGAGAIPARFGGAELPPGMFAVSAWVTPLSCTLLHGSIGHLLLNMVMLAFCGIQVERAIGSGGVVIAYVAGAYAAAAGQWLLAPGSPVPMIGASGAVSALVAAYALLFGQRKPAALGPVSGHALHVLWLAAAWVGIQALTGLAGMGLPGAGGAPVAIGAHVGGFIAGLALARPLLLWRYRRA